MSRRTAFQKAFILFAILFLTVVHTVAAEGVALPELFITKVGKVTCGFTGPKWQSGTVKKGLFYSDLDKLATLKKQMKKAAGKKKAALLSQYNALKTKQKTNQKKCAKLPVPNVQPTPTATPSSPSVNLSALPSMSKFVASSHASPAVVSGTPPALIAIPGMVVKNVFWREGVVDAVTASTANATQCKEYWFGHADGESGGMASCNMANGVGYSLAPILQAGASLCHMQNVTSPALINAGGITLKEGTLPNNDLTELFKPPLAEPDRLVKVEISQPRAKNIFIRVYSVPHNLTAALKYKADMWFCNGGQALADVYQGLEVKDSNQYTFLFRSPEGRATGGWKFEITSNLTQNQDGSFGFDPDAARTAMLEYDEDTFRFKSELKVTPDDLVRRKTRWKFGVNWRLDYLVSHYAGDDITDLRFLEGVFKGEDHMEGQPVSGSVGASEFRDTRYLAVTNHPLLDEASSLSFADDPFYANEPSVTLDMSPYSCTAVPDVTVAMNAVNGAVAGMLSQCESKRIFDTNFCEGNTEVAAAKNNWQSYCPAVIGAGGANGR
jgi:hypothetical protein